MAEIKQELTLVDNFTKTFDDFIKQLDDINDKMNKLEEHMTKNDKSLEVYTNSVDKFSNMAVTNGIDSLIRKVTMLGAAYLGVSKAMKLVSDSFDIYDTGTRMSNRFNEIDPRANEALPVWMASMGNKYGENVNDVARTVNQFSHITTSTDKIEELMKMSARLASLNPGTTVAQAAQSLGGALESRNVEGLASQFGLNVADMKRMRLNFNLEMGNVDYVLDVLDDIMLKAGMTGEALEEFLNTPMQKFRQLGSTINNTVITAFMGFQVAVKDSLGVALEFTKTEPFQRMGDVLYRIFYVAGEAVGNFIEILTLAGPSILNGIYYGVSVAARGVELLTNNLSRIVPVVKNVIAGILIYKATMLAFNGVLKISSVAIGIYNTALGICATAQGVYTAATTAAAAGQSAFNAAVYAFPGTWIVAIIAAVVAGIVALVVAINNASNSMGILYNVVLSIFQAIIYLYNSVTAVINQVINSMNMVINAFGIAANFLATIFVNPITAVAGLFQDLFNFILKGVLGITDSIKSMTGGLVDWSSGVRDFMDSGNKSFDSFVDKNGGRNKVVDTSKEHISKIGEISYSSANNWTDTLFNLFNGVKADNIGLSQLSELKNIKEFIGEGNNKLDNINYALDPDAWRDGFNSFYVDDMERKNTLRINNNVQTPTINVTLNSNGEKTELDAETIAQAIKDILLQQMQAAGNLTATY